MKIEAKLKKQIVKHAATNLKKIRRTCGYKSASQFAADKGVHVQTYLNYESGKRGMSLPIILYLAYLLNVDYMAIIGDSRALLNFYK